MAAAAAAPPTSVASADPSERPPMGALVDEKKALRGLVRQRLRQLLPPERAEEDEAVQRHVAASDWFQQSRTICAYLSCAPLREVGTDRLVAQILSEGKRLYVPRIEDRSSHMRMLRIVEPQADTCRNSMQIAEPRPEDAHGKPREDVMEAGEPLDLVLLPGLAFDLKGGRLGRGGGYYDLFIQSYLERARPRGWKPPLLVALAYEAQICAEPIPMDATDAAIDGIVTRAGVHAVAGRQLDRP